MYLRLLGKRVTRKKENSFVRAVIFLLKKNQNQETILSHHFIQEEIHSVLKIVRRIREMVLQSRKKSTRIEATPTNFHICPQGACPPNTPPPLLSRPSHVCNVSPPPYTSRKCEKKDLVGIRESDKNWQREEQSIVFKLTVSTKICAESSRRHALQYKLPITDDLAWCDRGEDMKKKKINKHFTKSKETSTEKIGPFTKLYCWDSLSSSEVKKCPVVWM